jgi:hypothetical protein
MLEPSASTHADDTEVSATLLALLSQILKSGGRRAASSRQALVAGSATLEKTLVALDMGPLRWHPDRDQGSEHQPISSAPSCPAPVDALAVLSIDWSHSPGCARVPCGPPKIVGANRGGWPPPFKSACSRRVQDGFYRILFRDSI